MTSQQIYEYQVVPAPKTGLAKKGLKKTEDRFALQLETVMNDLARDGWEFVRAETLPCEERVGLTSKVEKFQNVLVFRRTLHSAPARTVDVIEETPEPVESNISTGTDTAALTSAVKSVAPAELESSETTKKPVLGLMRTIKGTREAGDTTPL